MQEIYTYKMDLLVYIVLLPLNIRNVDLCNINTYIHLCMDKQFRCVNHCDFNDFFHFFYSSLPIPLSRPISLTLFASSNSSTIMYIYTTIQLNDD